MAITTITNAMVSVNAIQGTLIADNAITAVHIATNAVSGTLIADNAVTATHIAQNVITVTQLADDCVESDKIADGVITTNHLNKAMISSQTEVAVATGDFILLGDTSDSNNLKKAPISSILAGTLTTAAQTNITSLGALTGLTVNGTADVDNLTINGAQGSDGQVLTSTGSGVAWEAASGGLATSGGTLTGDLAFGDGLKIKMGDTNEDFELYHIGGSVNVIRGIGAMVLQSNDYISLGTHSDGELMLKATKNGSTDLYYDNLVKLQTTDKGCLVQSSGSKDVTIGMSNGDQDWHIGIDESAGDYFRLGKHSGMGNNCVYSVTPGYKHRFEGAHQGDSVGTWVFDNQNLGDGTTTNCTLMVKNGNCQVQIMPWSSLGARIGTRGGGWSSNSNNAVHLTSNDAGNIILNTNGSPTLANGTAISSDERLKKNITDIASGQPAKIKALTPRNFEWKDSRKSGAQEGFIAQEVAAVIPEAVEDRLCSPDPDDTSRDFEGDVKVLKHEVINARLIKAVQELSAELDAAKARITTLEG